MKKLQIAFLTHWKDEIESTLQFVTNSVPEHKQKAKIYLKLMHKDTVTMHKQLSVINTLLETLYDR